MSQVDDAINYARAQIGKPYVFATAGPDTFDCSGLVMAAYAHANPPIILPHYTVAMLGFGKKVSRDQLQPGDAIFPNSGHVQLFIGGNQVIEAPNEDTPVQMVPVGEVWEVRRFANDGKGTSLDVGKVIEGIQNGIKTGSSLLIPDPIENVLVKTGTLVDNLIGPAMWRRAGMMMVGGSLIVLGLIWLARRPIMAGVGTATSAATGLASSAVQGAAFGYGASRVGGPIQGQASVGPPTPTPKPAPKAYLPSTGRRTLAIVGGANRTTTRPPIKVTASNPQTPPRIRRTIIWDTSSTPYQGRHKREG